MNISVYNSQGQAVRETTLPERLFAVAPKMAVIHQVVVAQQSNARAVLAVTKDRSMVEGGGKKPWKQKGTGRARQGSIRAPQWRGGGIVFGPTGGENFTKAVNQKQKQVALAMCLSDKVANNNFIIVDELPGADGKTKSLLTWIEGLRAGLKSEAKGKVLIITPSHQETIVRTTLNLPKVKVINADSLNCVALLGNEQVVTSEEAIAVIDRHYQSVKAKVAAKK